MAAYINVEWRWPSEDSQTTYGVAVGEPVGVPLGATSMVIHVGSTETET